MSWSDCAGACSEGTSAGAGESLTLCARLGSVIDFRFSANASKDCLFAGVMMVSGLPGLPRLETEDLRDAPSSSFKPASTLAADSSAAETILWLSDSFAVALTELELAPFCAMPTRPISVPGKASSGRGVFTTGGSTANGVMDGSGSQDILRPAGKAPYIQSSSVLSALGLPGRLAALLSDLCLC